MDLKARVKKVLDQNHFEHIHRLEEEFELISRSDSEVIEMIAINSLELYKQLKKSSSKEMVDRSRKLTRRYFELLAEAYEREGNPQDYNQFYKTAVREGIF
jgi:hypothetical protein